MCLCAKGSSIADSKTYTNSEATLTIDGSGSDDLQADWKLIKGICKPAAGSLSPVSLMAATKAAVGTIASRTINGGKTTHILGNAHGNSSGGCDATAIDGGNKGQCVYYGRDAGTNITYRIAWASNLENAASLPDEAADKKSRAVDLMSKLKLLNETLAALSIASRQPKPPTTAPASDINSQNNKLTKIECAKLTTKATCTEARCKWTSTDRSDGDFCKPKDREGQTNTAGAGEGAAGAAASAGCARHGSDKAACENNKTGDKQNCALMKGREGEDEH
ncbi:Trypanosome variant surface glycoprotein C-terminal domain containing protein [Trypanosoma brucei equiperdum]|uniref:Trypanosome variant surface glycoprotein C-terminal domain containing protein n=2 Tax=Trypanosoma brucei TaxID=5691 RepID=A0A3L6L0L6_9TRYP|nr:Trypanosome variant surface glycoprotein C-terminal domain containing protein [Trypanosoma brucei equiperdum]